MGKRARSNIEGSIPERADIRHAEALLITGALQAAIFYNPRFSCIATDANGVIQLFNVGAERMLGYPAVEVVNKITPAELHDPQEVIAHAAALSLEYATPITPGFEALVFKAARGIEDVYELTKVRKDGSRFPAVVSVSALRDAQGRDHRLSPDRHREHFPDEGARRAHPIFLGLARHALHARL